MKSDTKQCRNCKQNFQIEPEDFLFYQKIKVPAPTWCPECRLQRRLLFLNFINLYRRKCSLCGRDFIAEYHPDAPIVVYCPECWWSDKWDARDFGQDYDFSHPFFEQFKNLLERTPVIGVPIDFVTALSSPYNSHAGNLKQCYLLSEADEDEDSGYGVYVFYSKSVYDSSLVQYCDTCYDSMHIYKVSYGVGLRNQVYESSNCYFLRDCHNCQDCFASANLRNKQYYIFNKSYSKDEYFKELKKWDFGSYQNYQKAKVLAQEHWKKYPIKVRFEDFSVNCTGNYIFQSKNCRNCHETTRAEDSRYLFMVRDVKDSYDITSWGEIELCYEGIFGRNATGGRFGVMCAEGAFNTEYSILSHGGATNNFGCVSTRKNYCILNKQYSKEDYFDLIKKIKAHMDEMPYQDGQGRIYKYGEFFPSEFSPFGYNESLASNMFPLSKEEALRKGFLWREKPELFHKIDREAADLPDHIKDVSEEILQEVIRCEKCQKGYRIIPNELSFLRRRGLPLPRNCPLCRINEKLDLWMRELKSVKSKCSRCFRDVEVPSLYASEKVILCKECYQKEAV